jgi:acetylserotonin N-methyltransferase
VKGQYLSPPVDDRQIWDIWLSFHNLPTMLAADEISLFDALADGPLALGDLARKCHVNARALGIVNSLLCALGLLVRRDGRYGLTPVSRNYLVKTSNFYWGALLTGFRQSAPSTEQIIAALAPDAQHLGGENAKGWEAGDIPLDRARQIAAFMHAHSCAAAIGAAQHAVFADVKRVLDVGGGSGVFPIAMAQRWKHLRGTILDLGTMCEAAMHYVLAGEVADRVDTVPVDMFREPWPTGYDALFFSNVFHDWSDETCLDPARGADQRQSRWPGERGVLLDPDAVRNAGPPVHPAGIWRAARQGRFCRLRGERNLRLLFARDRAQALSKAAMLIGTPRARMAWVRGLGPEVRGLGVVAV